MSFTYNKAMCLTLDKRYHKALEIRTEAAKLGINVQLFIGGDGTLVLPYNHIDTPEMPPHMPHMTTYPAWHARPNAYNAWKCHQKILDYALEKDIDPLLMLEDDVIFESDFEKIINESKDFLNNNEWDMVYFGWYSNGHLHYIGHPHVYRFMGGAGFHGVLMRKHIIEKLVVMPPLGPYDWMCGQWIHPEFKCYAIHPSIITQVSGYSYVEDGNLEKPDRNFK
jgi:hypothetical protein